MNIITELPTLLNDALFDGDSSTLFLAKLILCAIVIFASAIPLLYFDVSIKQLMVFELIIVLILTGLTWLDPAIMILLVLGIALTLSESVVKRMLGGEK